jgi:DNA-binding FadR family transcriptional regulator
MQRLEKLGLIVITHGERARVSQPTVADVIGQIEHAARHILMTQPGSLSQLQDARIFFEIGMVREAARLADEQDIARLEAALARQAAFLEKDSGRFVTADMDFPQWRAGSGEPRHAPLAQHVSCESAAVERA